MSRLEDFRRSAMGATVAAALASRAAPAAGRYSAARSSGARHAGPGEGRESVRSREEKRKLIRKLARSMRVVDDVAERIERRTFELEWLMNSYETMKDEIAWALCEAGGSVSAEESLSLAANVVAKHMAAISSSGVSAVPAGGMGDPNRLALPATPEGIVASGYGFMDALQRRIEGLVSEATALPGMHGDGGGKDAMPVLKTVMAFAAGIEEDLAADSRLEESGIEAEALAFH